MNTIIKNTKRDTAIDILKGWSIMAIMLLHYENGLFSETVNVWFGSFMVSSFYLTAAWVMTLRPLPTLKDAFSKLWRSLGWPYISFSLIICLFSTLLCLCGQMEWEILIRDIYKFLCLRGIGTLWFLPALFFGEILFLFFIRKKLPVKFLILGITMVYTACYWRWYYNYREASTIMKIIDAPLNALWRICNAWVSIAVFYAFAKSCREQMNELSKRQLIFSAFVLLSIYTILIASSLLSQYTLITGWLGPIGLFFLAKATNSLFINYPFEYFGRNSLIVMAVHFSILQQLCIVINRNLTGQLALTGWTAIGYYAMSVLLIIPIIKLFSNNQFIHIALR